jgi:hypothetical protein
MRKIVYPILQWIDTGKWIDILERKSFELLGNKIMDYPREKLQEL